MSSPNRMAWRWRTAGSLLASIFVLVSAFLAPNLVFAQQIVCKCGELVDGFCIPACRRINVPVGTGCGGSCDVTDILRRLDIEEIPWDRDELWHVDARQLLPGATLEPGDRVTLMLVREIPATEGLQLPLMIDDQPAIFQLQVGTDGSAVYNLGEFAESIVGGRYSILAIRGEVETITQFWDDLASVAESERGVLRYVLKDLAALEAESATSDANQRRIDIPVSLDSTLTRDVDVDIQVRREGEPLPQAQNPLMPGVFDTVAPVPEPGAVRLYAPGEYVLETYAPALAPVVSPYLGAYFTPGEYEVDVTVNGVLESTTTFVVP